MGRHQIISAINILVSFAFIASPGLIVNKICNMVYPKDDSEMMSNGIGSLIIMGMFIYIISAPEFEILNQKNYPLYVFNIILAFAFLWYKKPQEKIKDDLV